MLDETTTVDFPLKLASLYSETTSSERRASHFVLTGKGGCGKSMVAGFIAEYLAETGTPVRCVDADPINSTLAGIDAHKAEVAELLVDEAINVTAMDSLISKIIETDSNYIIDAGASGFVPLSSFMLRDELFDLLDSAGKQVIVHAVIQGGDGMFDTATGLADMLKQFPNCIKFVVWLNPFPSKLIHKNTPIEDTAFWKDEVAPRCSVVRIEELNTVARQTFRKLLNARKTFAEAMFMPEFNAVERHRLTHIWARLRTQISAAIA